jgi:hypothetical protein
MTDKVLSGPPYKGSHIYQLLTNLELEMDATPRRAAWSAAWGVLAVVLGSGAVTTWMAALAQGTRFLVWPAWTLAIMTAIALYVSFAYLAGIWPSNRNTEDDQSIDVDLLPEQVGDRLRLRLVNCGSAAEFLAQVTSALDPLRQSGAPQCWTIPWLEDNSVEPKRILVGGTQVLDFAWYDIEAVDAELRTGHDDAGHWYFSAVPAPIGMRYYNLRSRNDLELQRFTLAVRIMSASSGKYVDRRLTVGIQDSNLVCEIS